MGILPVDGLWPAGAGASDGTVKCVRPKAANGLRDGAFWASWSLGVRLVDCAFDAALQRGGLRTGVFYVIQFVHTCQLIIMERSRFWTLTVYNCDAALCSFCALHLRCTALFCSFAIFSCAR